MKQLLLLVAMATIALSANAANYYFSTAGDDSRTAAQAQSAATPWKTIGKLNSFFSSLRTGDSVLLKRGDVFYGQLFLSGYSTDRIVVSAYGTGAKPVITGFTQVTGWQSFGGNRYEASLAGGAALNMVSIDNRPQAMGRTPNANAANGGYLTFTGHNGTTSITSPSIDATTSWTGAQVVIRKTRWIIDRGLVTAQAGNTLYYNSPTSIQPEDGFGFFYQDSYATLDTDGEWYYNAGNKKLDIYSSTNPAGRIVRAATIDTLVYIYAKDNLTLDNISFEGSNVQSFQVNNCNYTTIKNCDINYSGLNAVNLQSTTNITFTGNTISNTQNNAFYGITETTTITSNTVRNTGLWPGMGKNDNQARMGLLTAGNRNLIQYNRFDSCGYIAIYMNGNNAQVLNNHISNFCLSTDDGGGIYASGEPSATGRVIRGNIVVNGRGNRYGTNQSEDLAASGIYMDDRSAGVLIEGNTVANCSENGIFLHNAHEITVRSNTVFNVNRQMSMAHDGIATGDPIRNISMKGNLFVSKSSSQLSMALYSRVNDIAQYGSLDSNMYYYPQTGSSFQVTTNTESSYTQNAYTLDQIRSLYAFHRNSQEKVVNTSDDMLRLEYNGTSSAKVVSLGATYTGLGDGTATSSLTAPMTQVTLAPYSSVILVKSALVAAPVVVKNMRPIARAGADQVISSSTVSLSGAGSQDLDGQIVSYSWNKISGPAQFNLVAPLNVDVAPKNLVPGVYTFRLKVVDDLGGNSLDTVQVTVLATKAASTQATASVSAEEAVTAVKTGVAVGGMNVYPNPASQVINVRYSNPQTGRVKVTIYDAAGRAVDVKDDSKTQASFTAQVSVSQLRQGSYYAEVRMENGDRMVQGFVKF